MTEPSQPETDSSTHWHVTVWTPAGGSLGEVAGIMDEAGLQQAVILSGPHGLQPEDIERANFIVRAANNHTKLLKALKFCRSVLEANPVEMSERMAIDEASTAIEEAQP